MVSQDNIRCYKCHKECGYDNNQGICVPKTDDWRETAICGHCKRQLLDKFFSFFGGDSSDEYGARLSWENIENLLARIKRNFPQRIYEISDKELLTNQKEQV